MDVIFGYIDFLNEEIMAHSIVNKTMESRSIFLQPFKNDFCTSLGIMWGSLVLSDRYPIYKKFSQEDIIKKFLNGTTVKGIVYRDKKEEGYKALFKEERPVPSNSYPFSRRLGEMLGFCNHDVEKSGFPSLEEDDEFDRVKNNNVSELTKSLESMVKVLGRYL